jgi:hypothetical protein
MKIKRPSRSTPPNYRKQKAERRDRSENHCFDVVCLIFFFFSFLGILSLRFSRTSSLSAFLRSCTIRATQNVRSASCHLPRRNVRNKHDRSRTHLLRLPVLVPLPPRLTLLELLAFLSLPILTLLFAPTRDLVLLVDPLREPNALLVLLYSILDF